MDFLKDRLAPLGFVKDFHSLLGGGHKKNISKIFVIIMGMELKDKTR